MTTAPSHASTQVDTSTELVVASVPSGHVYVRHLDDVDGASTVRRLPDPDPADPRRAATQRWWPPVMLEPQWAARHEYDIFHLQFGFDACPPTQLTELVGILKERRTPLVYTAHDLRNPHHESRAAHDAQLDVLMPGSDAVITLTQGAADEIQRRWGRVAQVLPHPHVVDLATMSQVADARAARPGSGRFRVGLHVKSLRASMDPMRLLPTLVETVRDLPDAVLRVDAHRDVVEDGAPRQDPDLAGYLRDQAAAGALDLHVHDYFTDAELWAYLASLEVSVLPYRFGTHSGWLEACLDLGTRVIAPTCGYFAEQGPVLSYQHDEVSYDADSLRAALVQAYHEAHGEGSDDRTGHAAQVDERRRQRRAVSDAHLELYRSLVS